MRVIHRFSHGVKVPVPVRFRSPLTLSADPSIGPGGGIDLHAIERVVDGAHPRPVLTKTEARVAWLLLDDPEQELSLAEISRIIGVADRTVARWRSGDTAEQQLPDVREGTVMRSDWDYEAACRDTLDPEWWFPNGFQSVPDKVQAAQAASVCFNRCPVRRECLRSAMDREAGQAVGGRSGVWGGLTPSQRVATQKVLDGRATRAERAEVESLDSLGALSA